MPARRPLLQVGLQPQARPLHRVRVQRALPQDMTSPPAYRQVNPADAPILLIALTSPSLAPSELQDFAEHLITPTLSTIDGVAQVNIFGPNRFAVRVRVNPEALASRNIGLDELSAALRAANVNTPVDTLEGPRQTLQLQANKQLSSAAELAELIVATRAGAPVRLKDVAAVQDSVEQLKSWATLNGDNSITLAVLRQPGANTVRVVDAVRAALSSLKSPLPQSITLTPVNDRSASAREALHDVTLSLMGTVALVVLVIPRGGPGRGRGHRDVGEHHPPSRRRRAALSSFATVQRTVGPTAINHVGQLQAVTVSFNLAPGTALGDATSNIEKARQAMQMPSSGITSYGGDAAVFKSSQGSQTILIVAALLVIYGLLGVLYESYIHPITVLAGLPSAAVGALATLMLFGQDLTLIAMMGVLLLIGILKKYAMMMIDFALDAQRHQGMAPEQAIREACILRFRPIMMTTLPALMGPLPIALGLGAGAELRQPLGLAVVGGLVFSQAVTRYITPVIYLALDRFSGRVPVMTAEAAVPASKAA